MKEYLLELFKYNDWANRSLLESIRKIPDQAEAVKLFSHLITSQDKWLNRILKEVDDTTLSWFGEVFAIGQLEEKWSYSYERWMALLQSKSEQELADDIVFTRQMDGKHMKVKLQDVVLQLNYHSIHHRAQINRLLSQQGIAPPATDYILTAIREA